MNVLDLFSGIGGFSLGLERAGMRTVAFCEIEPFCRAVLKKHWPHVSCYDDVRTLTADRLAADGIRVDLICGGFPCQDISVAGKGAGLEGERSGLWSEYRRLIGELRPRFAIVENVSMLLGRGLGRVLGDLAAIGYDAEWHCIPACAVGAPHIRDRIWIVAYPCGAERGALGSACQRVAWAECLSQWQEGSGGSEPGSQTLADADKSLHASELDTGTVSGTPSPGEAGDPCEGQASYGQRLRSESRTGRSDRPDADCSRLSLSGAQQIRVDGQQGWRVPSSIYWWSSEPDVGRVAHGIPARVDRIGSLGNAVVPQIPEIIGRAIMKHVHR